MTHDELRELVPLYALDALGGGEELEVQTHLETCSPCRTLLETNVQAAAGLALIAEPVQPPEALRRRLMEAVATIPQGAPVIPAVSRRQRRPVTWRRLSAIVAVAALLILGAFSYRQSQRLHQRDKTLQAQAQFFQALANPLATAVPLSGTGNAAAASGELYVAPDGHTAGLVARGLPDPGKSIYQLWLIVDNTQVPVQAFRPDGSGLALVQIRSNLAGMQGMAVTLEAKGGKSKPEGPFVLRT
ncbi:MAG TPA: anti-sigma factor [Actinomycetota bacterium]|nr:anti-sigma factor [Actinomycetota bacterium]